jgi:uncharacterized membrane protein YhhN
MTERKMILMAAASGLVYILADITVGGFPFDFLPKTIPIWVLCYLVFTSVRNREGRLVGLGLLSGSGGDVALALGHFVTGLSFFLIGHLFYIAAWTQRFQFRTVRAIPGILVFAVAAILSFWLTPVLAGLTIPVYAYIGVISVMSALSFLRNRESLILPAGTVLFVVSDAIIAINRFLFPVPLSGLWIMLTYYAAQAMIAYGFIKENTSSGISSHTPEKKPQAAL